MHSPYLDKIISQLSENIDEDHLESSIKKFFTGIGNKVEIHGFNGELYKILKSKPVVIAGNHPYDAEPAVVIGSLPDREDMFLINESSFQEFLSEYLPKVGKHMIPVYLAKDEDNENKISLKILNTIFKHNKISIKEAHDKNIASIKLAADKVNHGGEVIIFPEGGRGGTKWFDGIGYIIKDIKDKDAYFVPIFIKGTNFIDMVRMVPVMARFMTPLHVYFGKPIHVTEILKLHDDPKDIRRYLEEKFYELVDQSMK